MPVSKPNIKAIRQTLLDNIGKFDHLLTKTLLSHTFILLDLTIDGVAGKLEITREYLRLWLDNKKPEHALLMYALHAVMLKRCEELLKE